MMHEFEGDENLISAIFALGANFFIQGKYEKAEIIFSGLMALKPDHKESIIAYGEVLMAMGKLENALEHFLASLKASFLDSRIYLNAAKVSLLLGYHQEAKDLAKPIVEGSVEATPTICLMAQLIYKNQ